MTKKEGVTSVFHRVQFQSINKGMDDVLVSGVCIGQIYSEVDGEWVVIFEASGSLPADVLLSISLELRRRNTRILRESAECPTSQLGLDFGESSGVN